MYLVLLIPAFPLQTVQRLEAEGDVPPEPAAVTEARGKQSRVVAANELALASGVELGQSLAQARARVRGLRAHSRQPASEAAAMDLLFALAYVHTPYLERTAPGLLTLELRGLREGNPERLAHTLLATLHQWGLRTLGDLSALPRAEVSRRLGAEAAEIWEQASGERRRLLERAEPPRVFRVYHKIEYTVHTLEPLL